MKKLFILSIIAFALASCQRSSQELSVIPMPQHIEYARGTLSIDEPLQLHIAAPQADSTILHHYITASGIPLHPTSKKTLTLTLTGVEESSSDINRCNATHPEALPIEGADARGASVATKGVLTPPRSQGLESYTLTITPKGITIAAPSGAGLFYGVQTLLQLRAQSPTLPLCTITDAPRFAYRGVMLDVSRHFFPVEFIKKQLDAMAHYKMNHLHLHLTDAAGWRLEIKRYPELTRRAAWRTHATWKEWWNDERHYADEGSAQAHGGYYTQDQIRDLVAYAQERYITIIPEIEMPSHSEEVLAVYPHLSCSGEPYRESDFCVGNEATFEFLENVLTEVLDLFPSEYIHIGGDEASKQSWHTCPRCQARMQREGMTHVDQLQSYLIHRIERFLNAHGRQLLGWDEILDGGLAPHATVMSWRGTEGGLRAIRAGHRAIMTPGAYCYLDAYQDAPHTQPEAFGGYLPLHKVYSYDPMPDTLSVSLRPLLYGVQANLFAEYIPTLEHMEYMMYPRVLAIAEVGWSHPSVKDYAHFRRRALRAISHLQRDGYHTFDLAGEVGDRPGSEQPVEHLAVGKQVSYVDGSAYYPGYSAGGDSALVNGLHGGWTYGDQRWQGFLGRKGVDLVIDLGAPHDIHSVSADFMQICGPGVFMPSHVTISISDDNQSFTLLTEIPNEVIRDDSVSFHTFGWQGQSRGRYIRYQAQRSHHGGFLFLDEVVVR